MKLSNFEFEIKSNSKRNSKSYNDQNRSFDGRLARRSANAFKQRRREFDEEFSFMI